MAAGQRLRRKKGRTAGRPSQVNSAPVNAPWKCLETHLEKHLEMTDSLIITCGTLPLVLHNKSSQSSLEQVFWWWVAFISVLYVERCGKHRWQCAEVTFTCSDGELCQRWASSIREQLAAIGTTSRQHTSRCQRGLWVMMLLLSTASRPKRLLVYINPCGGKRQGKRIYEQKVAPLLKQAGVSTEVIGKWCLFSSCSPHSCASDYTAKMCLRVFVGHSDGVCESCEGSPEDGGGAEEVRWVGLLFPRVLENPHSFSVEKPNRGYSQQPFTHQHFPLRSVVCVGGDGMFSEIIHGLIWRTQIDGGVDTSSPDKTLLPCSLRVGIIPAGHMDFL